MQLKSILVIALSLAASALAASLPRCADNFGALKITPSSFDVAEQFSIDADFHCPLSQGRVPTVAEYYLESASGSGTRVLLIRNDLTDRFDKSFDSWTGKVPQGDFSKEDKYIIKMEVDYSSGILVGATKGEGATSEGSVEVPVVLKL